MSKTEKRKKTVKTTKIDQTASKRPRRIGKGALKKKRHIGSRPKTIKEKIAQAKKKLSERIKKPEDPTRAFTFTGLDKKQYSINLRQKFFCELYLELDGKGYSAIIEAGYNVYNKHGVINFNLARSMASENLTKPNILAYIKLRLSDFGFDDENIGKQHLFLVNQFADLPTKAKAIDMYYKKKGEYAPDKTEHIFDQKITAALDRIDKILPK